MGCPNWEKCFIFMEHRYLVKGGVLCFIKKPLCFAVTQGYASSTHCYALQVHNFFSAWMECVIKLEKKIPSPSTHLNFWSWVQLADNSYQQTFAPLYLLEGVQRNIIFWSKNFVCAVLGRKCKFFFCSSSLSLSRSHLKNIPVASCLHLA